MRTTRVRIVGAELDPGEMEKTLWSSKSTSIAIAQAAGRWMASCSTCVAAWSSEAIGVLRPSGLELRTVSPGRGTEHLGNDVTEVSHPLVEKALFPESVLEERHPLVETGF